jgi:hypothetical protein
MGVYVGGTRISGAAASGRSVVGVFLGDTLLWPVSARELVASIVSVSVAVASVAAGVSSSASSGSSASGVLVVKQQGAAVSESEVYAEQDDKDYDARAVSISYLGGGASTSLIGAVTSESDNPGSLLVGLFGNASSEVEVFASVDDSDNDANAVSLSYVGSGSGIGQLPISSGALGTAAVVVSAKADAVSEVEVYASVDDGDDKDANAVSLSFIGFGATPGSVASTASNSVSGAVVSPSLNAPAVSEAEVYASIDDSDKDANAVSLSYVGSGSGIGGFPITSGSFGTAAVTVSSSASAVSESEVYAEQDDKDYDARAASVSTPGGEAVFTAGASPVSVSLVNGDSGLGSLPTSSESFAVGVVVPQIYAAAVSESEVYAEPDDKDYDARAVSLSYPAGAVSGVNAGVLPVSVSGLAGDQVAALTAAAVSESETYAEPDDKDYDARAVSLSYLGGGAGLSWSAVSGSESSIAAGALPALKLLAASECEVYAEMDDRDLDASAVSLSVVNSDSGLGRLPTSSVSNASGITVLNVRADCVSESEVYAEPDDKDYDARAVWFSYPGGGIMAVSSAAASSEAEVYASVDDNDKDANAASLSYPGGGAAPAALLAAFTDSGALISASPAVKAEARSESEVYAELDDQDLDARAVSVSLVNSDSGLGRFPTISVSSPVAGVLTNLKADAVSDVEVYAELDDKDKDARAFSLSYPGGGVAGVAASASATTILNVGGEVSPQVKATSVSESEVYAELDDQDFDARAVSVSVVNGDSGLGRLPSSSESYALSATGISLKAACVSEAEIFAAVDDNDKDANAVSLLYPSGGVKVLAAVAPVSGSAVSLGFVVGLRADAVSEAEVYAELDDRDEDAKAVSVSIPGLSPVGVTASTVTQSAASVAAGASAAGGSASVSGGGGVIGGFVATSGSASYLTSGFGIGSGGVSASSASAELSVLAAADLAADSDLDSTVEISMVLQINNSQTVEIPAWAKKLDVLVVGGGAGSTGSASLSYGIGGGGGKWDYGEHLLDSLLEASGSAAERFTVVFDIGSNGVGGAGTGLGSLQPGTSGRASKAVINAVTGLTVRPLVTMTGAGGAHATNTTTVGITQSEAQPGKAVTGGNANGGKDVSLNPPYWFNLANQNLYVGGGQAAAGNAGNAPGGGGAGRAAGNQAGTSGAPGRGWIRIYSGSSVEQQAWRTPGSYTRKLPLTVTEFYPVLIGGGGGGSGGTGGLVGNGGDGARWAYPVAAQVVDTLLAAKGLSRSDVAEFGVDVVVGGGGRGSSGVLLGLGSAGGAGGLSSLDFYCRTTVGAKVVLLNLRSSGGAGNANTTTTNAVGTQATGGNSGLGGGVGSRKDVIVNFKRKNYTFIGGADTVANATNGFPGNAPGGGGSGGNLGIGALLISGGDGYNGGNGAVYLIFD